ncbi:hypothetical protein MishRS11D_25280 [Methylomagnum ishizawai]|nr:hypothetical protein MishRS11D_25280 [Methylomagnum ishizawai]
MRIRLPNDLKERIEAAAHQGRRSMNAEIIARLEASLNAEESRLPPAMEEELAAMRRAFERQVNEVVEDFKKRRQKIEQAGAG